MVRWTACVGDGENAYHAENAHHAATDETLFRLIKGEIPHQTMPTAFGQELTDAQIWQVLAFVRSIYKGDPSKINW